MKRYPTVKAWRFIMRPRIYDAALALMALAVMATQATHADSIPALKSAKDAAYPETIDGFYTIPYVEELRALLVFVDFDNLPGDAEGQRTPEEIAQNLLGIRKDGSMEIVDLFKQQSYGKLEFSVDVDYEWIRIPKEVSKKYPGRLSRRRPKAYLQDAFKAAASREHKLGDYDIFYVAAPEGLHRSSPQHVVEPKDMPEVKNLPRAAVTFCDDGQDSRIEHTAHETAHGMGLPDLYSFGKVDRTPPGPWAIMADNWTAIGFCAWHRHLWGWLDDDRKVFAQSGTKIVDLVPIDSTQGTAMIVIPTDKFPQEVLVAENPKPWKEGIHPGVLLYKVNYAVEYGDVPVELILPPGVKEPTSANALWQPGQTYESKGYRLKVIKNRGGSYQVEAHRAE